MANGKQFIPLVIRRSKPSIIYKWTKGKWLITILEFLMIDLAIAYLFYQNLFFMIWGSPGFIFFYRWKVGYYMQKMKKQLRIEFQSFLETVTSAIGVGYSMEHAYTQGEEELNVVYKEGGILKPYIHKINEARRFHESMERATLEFAYESEVDEMISFGEIFAYSNRRGASMVLILKKCSHQISERLEVLAKLESVTAGIRLELRIMMIMPLGILGYLVLMNPQYIEVLYIGAFSRFIMTIALAFYSLACYIGIRTVSKIAKGES